MSDWPSTRAKRVLAAYGSEAALLLSELYESTPQWGGSVGKMRRLCDTIAPKVEDLSLAECHARATLMLWEQPRKTRDEAIEVLRREDEETALASMEDLEERLAKRNRRASEKTQPVSKAELEIISSTIVLSGFA